MTETKYSGDDVLDVMSKHAINRNNAIADIITRNLKLKDAPPGSRILEFGAGRGEFINRFTNSNLDLSAVEIDPDYLKKFSSTVKAYGDINDVPPALDAIYLIDVLEHLEDDRYFLKQFYSKLKSGGRLFIYVPARMELYSDFDKKIGHFRRYTIGELKEKVLQAGFKIEDVRYHELLGYFASMLNKFTSKSADLNPSSVKAYDKFLVPPTNFLEKFVKPPFGKSIYLTATREN